MTNSEIFANLGLFILVCAVAITILAWLTAEDPEHWNPWW